MVLIDNYDSFTYNLYQVIAGLVDQVLVVRNDEVTLDRLISIQPNALIISPGPGRPENAGITLEAIEYYYKRIPILGVCLGHQAIAMAFGGRIIPSPEILHGKSSLVTHTKGLLYQSVPTPFEAGRYHSLEVERSSLPQQLQIDAQTEGGSIMGMHHKSYPVFGIQFHPESVLTSHGPQIIHNFVQYCHGTQFMEACS